jgi:Arc/MetJ-type ribon-helix-helix transcriptional regulator
VSGADCWYLGSSYPSAWYKERYPSAWYKERRNECFVTSELEKIVAERIASGRCASADDVIAEALRLLDERDQLQNLPVSAKDLFDTLRKSGFIGMWKNRSDIGGSTDFVPCLRIDAEWRGHG